MGTYTGFNEGSDFAFHETPLHPLERIQQREAASIIMIITILLSIVFLKLILRVRTAT